MRRVIRKNPPKARQKSSICQILGVRISMISLRRGLSLLESWMESNKKYQIVTPNPEQIVLAQENDQFRQVLNQADLAIPDGIGLVWAARTTGKRLKRITGTDFMVAACRLAAQKGWRVFLLGAREAAALTANTLQLLYPKLQVAFDGGAEEINKESVSERKRVINKINDFRPHLLFVAYGAPYQELWIAKNLPLLRTKVAMGVGGAFDYLAGKVPRAPEWAQRLGLEWLFRLIRQPWRWRRQVGLFRFIWLALRQPQPVA